MLSDEVWIGSCTTAMLPGTIICNSVPPKDPLHATIPFFGVSFNIDLETNVP